MRRFFLHSLALLFVAGSADAATYRVGLAETGYAPFSFAKDDARVGIFLEILNAVGKVTGDKFEPVFAPTVRLKEMFEKGRIDIECGISPEWRKDQEAISVYSRQFATVEDVIIYREDEKPGTSPLAPLVKGKKPEKQYKVGTVRGYFYPAVEAAFKDQRLVREDADNEGQLVAMMMKKRVDMVLIGLYVARFYMKVNKDHGLAIGEVIGSAKVSFRVRKEKADLLKRMNPELDKLDKAGELDRIFRKQQ